MLGIDNIIFIAILTGYLPKKDQQRARALRLAMAMVFRIVLLGISWLVHLTEPLFQVGPLSPSGRDLILFAGGVFLVFRTLKEIIHKLSAPELDENGKVIKEKKLTVTQAILQIALIDIVFSFDSILTAVGLSSDLPGHDYRGSDLDDSNVVVRALCKQLHQQVSYDQDAGPRVPGLYRWTLDR